MLASRLRTWTETRVSLSRSSTPYDWHYVTVVLITQNTQWSFYWEGFDGRGEAGTVFISLRHFLSIGESKDWRYLNLDRDKLTGVAAFAWIPDGWEGEQESPHWTASSRNVGTDYTEAFARIFVAVSPGDNRMGRSQGLVARRLGKGTGAARMRAILQRRYSPPTERFKANLESPSLPDSHSYPLPHNAVPRSGGSGDPIRSVPDQLELMLSRVPHGRLFGL